MKYTAFGEISSEIKWNTNRIDIINNLHTDPENVMMIGFTLPVWNDVGHWVDVIGYDPDTDEIMFFNSAKGEEQSENALVNRYCYYWGGAAEGLEEAINSTQRSGRCRQ